MRINGCNALLAAIAVVAIGSAARAEIVYQNLNTAWVSYQPINPAEQLGDDVTLAGTARMVTSFSVVITNQYTQTYNATFTARFFKNNGLNGVPGDMIWQGTQTVSNGPAANASGQGGDLTVNFAVPSILVPDTFIWSIQANTNLPPPTSGDGIGPVLNDTPQIGSSHDVAYDNPGDGTGWAAYNYHPDQTDLANFQAVITALPEPATLSTFAIGGIALIRRRR